MNSFAPSALRRTITLLGVLLAWGAAVVPAGAAAAADDVTWTVRTASGSLGADRTSFSYSLNPGATVDDALVISNHGDAALDLAVYAADGFTTESGQFDILTADEKSVSIGAWTRGDADRITVAAGATVEYPFTVTIPSNATPGDYAGGIVTSLVVPDDSQGINVDRRLGIRMSVRVGGTLTPGLSIENPHLDWSGGLNPFAGGDASFSYTIHNTGNAVLTAHQTASVTGPFGWFPAETGVIADPPQLLPGESWTVSVPAKDMGAWFVLFGSATVTPIVVDASGSTTPLSPVTATAPGWAVPWMLLIIVVLLAAAVVLGLRWRRRALVRQQQREDELVRDAVERALGGAGAQPSS